MSNYCPYCDAVTMRVEGWYFECENGHTIHLDDWTVEELSKGVTVDEDN